MKIVHRAPLVLPMASSAIADGAVLLQDDTIIKIAPFADLQAEAGQVVDHEDCILMPSLINGHAHLELSAYASLAQQAVTAGDMVGWISRLLAARMADDEGGTQEAAGQTLASFQAEGVGLLVDIGNDPACCQPENNMVIETMFLLELLGLSAERAAAARTTLVDVADTQDLAVTAHAPYSTATSLLQEIKKRANRMGSLFSIHVAESQAELDLLSSGQGAFRDFLEERGGWDGSFQPPVSGSVAYLDKLGLLDEQTLCVHAVHLHPTEIELLAEKRAGVCLCPGSNRFLGVGTAPLPQLLAAGIMPAIGTDSAASNEHLSMWREMRLLGEDHPQVDPELILALATKHGAAAVQRHADFGALMLSMHGHFLAVRCDDFNEPFEFLVRDSAPKEVQWL